MPKSCPKGQRLITRGKESKCVRIPKTHKQQIAENEKKGFRLSPGMEEDYQEYLGKGYLEKKKKPKPKRR